MDFDPDYVNSPFGFDGVGITLEQSDNLIWSFVAGHGTGPQRCPCNSTISIPTTLMEIVNHYFCSETMNGEIWNEYNYCSSKEFCCGSNSPPPWFYTDMQQYTTDNIEVTICINSGLQDEAVYVRIMELYVQ